MHQGIVVNNQGRNLQIQNLSFQVGRLESRRYFTVPSIPSLCTLLPHGVSLYIKLPYLDAKSFMGSHFPRSLRGYYTSHSMGSRFALYVYNTMLTSALGGVIIPDDHQSTFSFSGLQEQNKHANINIRLQNPKKNTSFYLKKLLTVLYQSQFAIVIY